VTEPLGRVGDVARRRCRLRRNLGPRHCWQSLHQAATWEAKHGQTKRLEINRLVALIPGCVRL
jgi:hypothetical protein